MQRMSVSDVKSILATSAEYAFVDVREQEEYSNAHPLLACCLPLSRLELLAVALIPCKKISVMVMDDGDDLFPGRAALAVGRLEALGYTNVGHVDGGFMAWQKAGYEVFSGVGALSKAFGEFVEEELDTPRLDPEAVKELLDSGTDVKVIDVRPRSEFVRMNIPGSVNLPGCEVTYRIADVVPDPQTTIIINCAGRTRSIIGAQTLINAGIPNRVAALKGGTMNWSLAGYALEYGATRHSAPPSFTALETARGRSQDIAKEYGVNYVDVGQLQKWKKEADERTLYIFDVRQPEEFATGHIQGAQSTPGGQLVQATDEYAAVRNARYVLVDDTEVRAIMTAHWLQQMGLTQVFVLKGGIAAVQLSQEGLCCGEGSLNTPFEGKTISAIELYEAMKSAAQPLIINVGSSKEHRKGHIPTAVWIIRTYLGRVQKAYPNAKQIVLASDSGRLAQLAYSEVTALWKHSTVRCLIGGTLAWKKCGLAMAQGLEKPLCLEDDVWYKPYEDIGADTAAMREYFSWESRLVGMLKKDGDVTFKLGCESEVRSRA